MKNRNLVSHFKIGALAALLPLSLFADAQPAVVSLSNTPAPSQAEGSKPNIVFLMTDDQRWDTFGCYGRPEFKTVTIDRLASEGVIFDKAYHAVAICMPSRVSIMTGRYFASHNSGFTYPHDTPVSSEDLADTYHARLKVSGYRSGFIGKFGFYIEGGDKLAIADLKKHFDYFDANRGHTNFGGGRWAEMPETFDNLSKGRARTERTLKKGDSMIRFLETQPADQPFILSISFDAVKNDRDQDMHVPDKALFEKTEMTVPANWVEGANKKLPEVVQKNARGYKLHLQRTSTPELYQTLARRFAAQGVTVDTQVARLIEKLKEMKVLDNTVIIYTSDNGRQHGSQGIYDKCLLFEESIKAPLIIWDGRVAGEGKGKRVDPLVSSTDYAPTILTLAGVEVPAKMQGKSLTGILDGTQDLSQWRDANFIENLFIQEVHSAGVVAKRAGKTADFEAINKDIIANNRSYRSRGVVTKRFKYFSYYEHNPQVEELYDLEADPHEQNNLISNPEYATILSNLREQTETLHTQATAKP